MNTCCVRGCESSETNEYHITGGQGAFGKNLTYIVHVCENCKNSLRSEPVQLTCWRCGQLAFVNEMWKAD